MNRFATNPDIVFGDIDGQIVALNMKSGKYLHLNGTGTFIFHALKESGPQTLDWLLGRVGQEYDVDLTTSHKDVEAFVTRCLEVDLLRVEVR